MTYLEATTYAAAPELQARVMYILVKAARAVIAADPRNATQFAYARQVLADPRRFAEKVALGVMTLPVVASLGPAVVISDANLEAAVLDVLGDYAEAIF